MTNRLKRKLGDLGVDPTSVRANESFCLIGTPLPPLEKLKDTGEFVPLWKQDVRDEKGRRRLHGAFTGGFSAGYFNSVGSKEGWTPQTFVSSRGDRAKQKASRPEDFMDEEDLAELKESQSLVDTNEEMDLFGSTKDRRGGADDTEIDSVVRAIESCMLPPPKDSIGARILKNMGWRMGQGIGPRITYQQRRLQDMQADPGSNAHILEDDDEEAKKHMYAPRDTLVTIVQRKDNSHGLGYLPGLGLNESLGVKNADGGVSGPKLAAGFGLGALNDADDDDVDVYDGDIRKLSSRMAYDASDREDGDRISDYFVSKRPSSPTNKATFHNGQPVLAGFVLSDKPVAEDRWFPLPEIPKGWTPNPRRVWEAHKAPENETVQRGSSNPRRVLESVQRGSLLGETPLSTGPRSVFEYMSQKDRERLKNISTPSTSTPSTAALSIVIPRTEPHIAQLALRGFQPFTSDPFKQSRYTAYLNSQSIATAPPAPTPGQSIDDFNKELEEYAQAAQIFKPLGGAMAGRFTSAIMADKKPSNEGGLHIPSMDDKKQPTRETEKEDEKRDDVEKREDESPKAHAVRMGMYGQLTREVSPWMPAKLLCKRFGVKDPNPALEPELESTVATRSTAQPGSSEGASTGAGAEELTATVLSSKKSGPRDLSNIGLGEDDDQGRDTLTYKRPAMDIFKAIFASDDEDSGDDTVVEEPVKDSIPAPTVPTIPIPPPIVEEKVDIATFKPTFVPRSDRSKDKESEKDKKDKKKKLGKALVSFEPDEEGGELSIKPLKREKEKSRKKKRRKGDVGRIDHEDDGMWVEKPIPEVVRTLPHYEASQLQVAEDNGREEDAIGPPRGRKRAVDFL